MAVKFARPPAKSIRVLRQFEKESPQPGIAKAMAGGMKISIPAYKDVRKTNKPHRMYVLGLDDIRKERDLKKAEMVGWRYLIQSDAMEPMAAEVHHDVKEDIHDLGLLNQGPFVEGTFKALDTAAKNARVRNEDFEVALLKVPALYVVALWLTASGDDKDDLFLPLAPCPPPLKTGKVYSSEEFFNVLVEMANAVEDLGT